MNEKQQELYEKLLKKVNEFCLGQAAEDVIAAIDDLVDTYENKMTFVFGSRGNGKTIMLFNAYKEHKALEVLKECFDFEGFDEFIPNGKWFEKDIEERKEILKELTK